MEDRYFNDEYNMEFQKRIQTFLTDMTEFKKTHSNLWQDYYDDIVDELDEIASMVEENPIEANNSFQALPISKYENFSAYVFNNDINALQTIKGTNERTKTLRAKRKKNDCPVCGHQLKLSDAGAICSNCGYVGSSKSTVPNTRQTSNNNKHIFKQLDALTGTHKAPQNISKIIDYISLWLTDLRYIYNWLNSNGAKRYNQWVKKYQQLTDETINPTFFNRTIPREPNFMWEYNTYKLFTDELYAMLEDATRYSNESNSNLTGMPDDFIIIVFTKFCEQFKRLPTISETIDYDGKTWEIGLFINNISLLYEVPDDHIKSKLEALIGFSLTLPGLMFNYKQVYKKSENPPKKYCYQQEYCWITNRTFHTSFVDINKQDKEAIANLIIKFNDYYKEQAYTSSDKTCNSPLYCCTIICVINLPYFQKYKRVLNFIPVKDKSTAAHIRKKFFDFEISHPDLIEPYRKASAEVETNSVVMEVQKTTNELPDEIKFDDDLNF